MSYRNHELRRCDVVYTYIEDSSYEMMETSYDLFCMACHVLA